MKVTLEPVSLSTENALRAQRVLEAAPLYERLVSGGDVSSTSGEELLTDLPPGKTLDDKATFVVRLDGQDVGVIECIRGWRETGFAHIGLLLIAESHHGRGIGAAAMQSLETWIAATWQEVHTLRIGVIENNLAAFAFWKRLGFIDTGERRDNGFVAPAAVMLKQMHAETT